MTRIADDFVAIRSAMSPRPEPTDLPALLRELDRLDATWPKKIEDEDWHVAQIERIFDAFNSTVASNWRDVIAQLEYLDRFLDDHDGVDRSNAAVVRNVLASVRMLVSAAPPAEPIPQDGDALIRELFQQWRDAEEFASSAPGGTDYDLAFDRVEDLRDQIELTPASGGAGVAIKMFLELHELDAGSGPALASEPTMMARFAGQAVIVRDLIKLVPELGPLCADYLAALDAKAAAGDARPV